MFPGPLNFEFTPQVFAVLVSMFVVFVVAGCFSTMNFYTGMTSGPEELKAKLSKLWCGIPERKFAGYAYHEAPEPNRSDLRRSAWASLVSMIPWLGGCLVLGAWFFWIPGAIYWFYLFSLLLGRRSPENDATA